MVWSATSGLVVVDSRQVSGSGKRMSAEVSRGVARRDVAVGEVEEEEGRGDVEGEVHDDYEYQDYENRVWTVDILMTFGWH